MNKSLTIARSFGMYGHKGTVTLNAINEDYHAGGSSSGSAVSVKAYQSLGSLGTDTGGSVCYPAHCLGITSMKPSFGRLSRFGMITYASTNDVTGPMAHCVHDLH